MSEHKNEDKYGQEHVPGQENLHFAEAANICNDFMQGKADPARIMGLFSGNGGNFWKGAIVGALLTLVLTNKEVKSALGEAFSGILASGKDKEA